MNFSSKVTGCCPVNQLPQPFIKCNHFMAILFIFPLIFYYYLFVKFMFEVADALCGLTLLN